MGIFAMFVIEGTHSQRIILEGIKSFHFNEDFGIDLIYKRRQCYNCDGVK